MESGLNAKEIEMGTTAESLEVLFRLYLYLTPKQTWRHTKQRRFYEQLDDVVASIPKHDIQIIIGNLNAQLGNDTDTWKPALGKHAEGDFNNNGIRLLSLLHGTKACGWLIALPIQENTQADVTQIDHSIINQRWYNSIKDVCVYRGADVGSATLLL